MKYLLKLFLTGQSETSRRAVENLKTILETHLSDQYELDIVDTLDDPESATADGIIATPTLIKDLPPPLRKVIGDFSDSEKVLFGLGLVALDEDQETTDT